MSNIPSDLRYAKSHEWVRLESDGTATVGITDYAQNSLGDITYVQVPKVGAALRAGETFGVVESVKAASDLYSPISGTVVAVDGGLGAAPGTGHRGPCTDGGVVKLKEAGGAAPPRFVGGRG